MRRCFNCGSEATHDHHVVPRSLGGVATVPLCHECHGKAHGRTHGFRHISELTRAALQRKRAIGETSGTVPYGYTADPNGKLSPCADELRVIAIAKQMRESGITHRRIVDALERYGIVGRTGKPLGLSQVQRLVEWRPQTPSSAVESVVDMEKRKERREQLDLFATNHRSEPVR